MDLPSTLLVTPSGYQVMLVFTFDSRSVAGVLGTRPSSIAQRSRGGGRYSETDRRVNLVPRQEATMNRLLWTLFFMVAAALPGRPVKETGAPVAAHPRPDRSAPSGGTGNIVFLRPRLP